jgi:hypothetical protein
VVWKLSYAGRASGVGGKLTGTVTFATVSEKLSWLNRTICVMEGKGEAHPTKVGTNVFYEWSQLPHDEKICSNFQDLLFTVAANRSGRRHEP